MAPYIRFAGNPDGDSTAIFGVEVSDGMVHGKAAVFIEGHDDLVL